MKKQTFYSYSNNNGFGSFSNTIWDFSSHDEIATLNHKRMSERLTHNRNSRQWLPLSHRFTQCHVPKVVTSHVVRSRETVEHWADRVVRVSVCVFRPWWLWAIRHGIAILQNAHTAILLSHRQTNAYWRMRERDKGEQRFSTSSGVFLLCHRLPMSNNEAIWNNPPYKVEKLSIHHVKWPHSRDIYRALNPNDAEMYWNSSLPGKHCKANAETHSVDFQFQCGWFRGLPHQTCARYSRFELVSLHYSTLNLIDRVQFTFRSQTKI